MKILPQCLFLILASSLASATVEARVSPQEYDALIRGARAGHYEPALIMLRQRSLENPRDLRAAYDRILIAGWAGKTTEVISTYEAIHPTPNHMPAEALNTVARAYRDARRWDSALARYREGRRLYPARTSFAAGEIMVLADSGHTPDAVRLGQQMVAATPDDADLRLALGYAYKSSRAPYAELQQADQARTLAPKKTYVTREYLDALRQAGLASAALETARQHPELVSDAEMRGLQADDLAELSRLAAMPARLEAERFAIADRAIAQYDRLIPAWEALGPVAHDDVLRLRADRLQALHSRSRMKDVVAGYEELLAEGVQVPRYVLGDVASAYLALRKPDVARDLYRQVLNDGASAQDSAAELVDNRLGLYYSLIESEHFDEAAPLMETIRNSQPTWRYIKGLPQKVPNDLHLYTEQAAALGLFYADDTVGAQRRLEALVDEAPRSVGLRTALANVYRGRGWPRRSEAELKKAETLESRGIEVEAGQGLTALDLQEWRQAATLSQGLTAQYPENQSSQHLAREWQLYKKAELRVTGDRGLVSDSPITGNNDFSIDTVLYSAPINYNWRAFAGGGYSTGEFEEGRGQYRWQRAGVEWRGRDLTAEFEVSNNNYGFGNKPGAAITAAYDLSDQWQIGGAAELRSRETPLRALRNDVYSNSATAYVRWRASERREWKFSLSPAHFTDGNNRYTAILTGRERLYTSPHLKADLELNVAASHNTEEDVLYFNPRDDLEVLPTINLTHILYRRYETVWEHNLLLGAGTYTQRGFGTGAIAAVGYGMRYRYNDVFDIGATITGVSRPYDGIREREVRVMLNMTFRF